MRDASIYTIEIRGQIRPEDLAMLCPPGCQILHETPNGLTFAVETDQSGLIGLLRMLHARGIVFDAVRRSYPLPAVAGRG